MSNQHSPLYQLARFHGVETAYHSALGEHVEATPRALLLVLQRLGIDIHDPAQAKEYLLLGHREQWQTHIDPITLAWNGHGHAIIWGPTSQAGQRYALQLHLENGQQLRSNGVVSDLQQIGGTDLDGTTYGRWAIPLPTKTQGEALPLGIHKLSIRWGSLQLESHVYAAPEHVYTPWSGPDERYWGAFLPLYALHRDEPRATGQTGHLGDLKEMIDWVGQSGGDFVGTLPLLASYLDWPLEPSPYAPASRLFWNEFYLDIEALPEWHDIGRTAIDNAPTPPAGSWEPGFAMRDLKAGPFPRDEVHHYAEMLRKQTALQAMSDAFFAGPASQREAMMNWVESHPHASQYADFRAMMDHEQRPWQEWPEDWSTQAKSMVQERQRHLYCQWHLHQQLTAISNDQRDGLGLYLDLPLGVHPYGFDTWRYPHAFCHGMSTGAPPDALQIRGQNWGFPPLHPKTLRANHYDYLLDTYRNHMQYAGVLRIDHVLGLYRLFAVPDGLEATEGVYIRFEQDEIYAALSLESHRNQCLLLGEDLGTVPPQVAHAMERHNVQRMHVVQFAMTSDPHDALLTPRHNSIASLNTHDTPTFTGYWRNQDLDIAQQLSLFTPQTIHKLTQSRKCQRDALRVYLTAQGHIPQDAPHTLHELTQGALSWLASSPARLALVNLEDLWGEARPQNVPGTSNERPNWRKRATLSLEQMKASRGVQRAFSRFAEARSGQGHTHPPHHPQPVRHWPHNPDLRTWGIGDSRPSPKWFNTSDLYFFNEGTYTQGYETMGAHYHEQEGMAGVHFAVWAPNARQVSVMGDFNHWDAKRHPLFPQGHSGVWSGFIPGVSQGSLYKYAIHSQHHDIIIEKADPYGVMHECPPATASRVWDLQYLWDDATWMAKRHKHNRLEAPMSIYELHLGSWMRPAGQPDGFLSYREMAPKLAAYVKKLGFTHVELMPVMEHPFYGSWGYQVTGFFAATARYGTPQDLMFLIDTLHQHDIGVILDWVPSHFPGDAHGLARFDGTCLYEHEDPRRGHHPDWDSCIFNYGRHEVRSFLLSSAFFWMDKFHIDGLRVDAVASMLYLDYSREEGQWIPNRHGGRENLEAIFFLRQLNERIYQRFPDTQTIAEESTAWPLVSGPVSSGGLGFGLKWDMGWMHDTLRYLQRQPIHRKFHHNELTFRSLYAFSESFMMPLSHDEVVHGKGSLLRKMPGTTWQKMATLRLLYGYMFGQSGKKMMFMGSEFGMWKEWNHDGELSWNLLGDSGHQGIWHWVGQLNRLLQTEPALHDNDHDPTGFHWLQANDAEHSVYVFCRVPRQIDASPIVIVCNATPVVREAYSFAVPSAGEWQIIANSDDTDYGGAGIVTHEPDALLVTEEATTRQGHTLTLTIPALSVLFLKPVASAQSKDNQEQTK